MPCFLASFNHLASASLPSSLLFISTLLCFCCSASGSPDQALPTIHHLPRLSACRSSSSPTDIGSRAAPEALLVHALRCFLNCSSVLWRDESLDAEDLEDLLFLRLVRVSIMNLVRELFISSQIGMRHEEWRYAREFFFGNLLSALLDKLRNLFERG